jgi:hypothetical protein
MQMLATNELAVLAKTDRVAADVLLRRFEKGMNTPERRQLVAFITRRFGARWLASDDFMQETRILTWEALSKWNPERAAFMSFLQGSALLNLSHVRRADRLHTNRTVPLDDAGVRVAGQPSASELEAARRWREVTQDRAEDEARDEVLDLVEDIRTVLAAGLLKNADARTGTRHFLAALALLVDGLEEKEFAASLDDRRNRTQTEAARRHHPGSVRREQTARWLSSARAEMLKEAHQLGLDERLVRVALRVTDDDLWQRVRLQAGLTGVVVEGAVGREA